MKSKFVFGLIAIVVILTLAPSSFAQVQIRLFNTPSAAEIATNRNAQTADPTSSGAGLTVTGELIASSPLTTTRLRLTFPAPITSAPAAISGQASTGGALNPGAGVPTSDAIRIEGGTGLFAGVTAVATVNYNNGTIDVFLPGAAPATPNTLSGSFRVLGVRIDANGKTGPQTLSGALESSANNYFPPTETPNVITVLDSPFTGFGIGARSGLTSDGTAAIFTNRTVTDFFASFIITEKFASAFRTPTQVSSNATALPNGVGIRLTFNNVPTNLPAMALACTGSSGLTPVVSNAAITSTANTSDITFTATNLSTTQTVDCRLALGFPVPTTVTLTAGADITVTADLIPIGGALDTATAGSINTPTVTGGYPRFASASVGPITVVSILAANTTMIIPFAARIGAFDTGIAIANTTADPFGAAGGGFTAAGGNVRMDFFPATTTGAGTSATLTTATGKTTGRGIAADGTVAGGATWTVNLSELMPLTTPPLTGDFLGYIFVQAAFPAGHGASFIFDGPRLTSTTPVLVIVPPSVAARTAGIIEGVSF